ncbi:hypothetical protein D1614_01380 [Maribellus luteus]|uniref:Uncharacterized protein n=1 Tax=Maribellus luteus TaxID=2305463 RepID=A0A399T2R1_9BACT|nr:hypothetical protein [Maribellus luteus]RIJ50616.1 hypothetical protein D1614_01380 [Maribellus luteus]
MLTQDLEGTHIVFARKPEEDCEAYLKGEFSQTKLKQGEEIEQCKSCTFKYEPGIDFTPYNHISLLKFRNEKLVKAPTTNDRCSKNTMKKYGYFHKLYSCNMSGAG